MRVIPQISSKGLIVANQEDWKGERYGDRKGKEREKGRREGRDRGGRTIVNFHLALTMCHMLWKLI